MVKAAALAAVAFRPVVSAMTSTNSRPEATASSFAIDELVSLPFVNVASHDRRCPRALRRRSQPDHLPRLPSTRAWSSYEPIEEVGQPHFVEHRPCEAARLSVNSRSHCHHL
ncbi:hypothetical protein BRADI_3g41834v3 [Brachypodium distachyon]|uniref:Secreted protein n=1 Tax=Brachypodium distachyon TaxID=15368 RepID=A0A2K2D2N0_BRADI|nr:hypothetical protein BRADI_3g41834v3 [Brachypodium distachyon]